jgi:hypothetical protein
MADYAVLKINKETKEALFLMANAAGTKTFKNDFRDAWTNKDHRVASDMLDRCVSRHNDTDEFDYIIDDLSEVGDY